MSLQAQPQALQRRSPPLESVTILLIFLIIVINQIFLISLTAILLKKIKHIIKSTAKKYYYFVIFYIVSKLALCVFLQIKIITGIPNDFKDIQSQSVQKIFDNSLVFADCSIVQLFLISFEHYIALSFSVFGNKKVERTIRILMQGVQLVTFFTLLVPLLLFNINIISYQTLNIFTMSLNLLSVIVFIAAFFFMNFKMTGLMMDRRATEIIKRVYALLLALLVSRVIMCAVQVWVEINIANGSFQDFISIIQQKQNQYVVLGLCFIFYLVIILLSQGLPLIMSLRESVVAAMSQANKKPRSRSSSLQQSMITDSINDVRQDLFSNMDLIEEEEKKETEKKSKVIPDSYYGLSKIEEPDQLEVQEKIQVVSQDFLAFKAKWTRNNKFYFVRQFGKISNYIIQEILNEIQKYILSEVKVINPMKILQKNNEQKVLIIQKYLPQNLQKKMDQMVQQNASIKQKIAIAIKIAKSIKQFNQNLKIGHGVINPKNILFDDDGNVYLTGFGMESLKKYLSLTTQYSNITMYTAVQLLGSSRQKTITKPQKQADVYSFGMVLYELVSNNFNYRNLSFTEIRNKFLKQNTRPKIPQDMSEDLKKIMRKCWQEKPENRPQINWVITSLQNYKTNL